jgi:dTDP-4-dehydrorhamnose reductase
MYVIIGANGFVGTYLIAAVKKSGEKIIAVCRNVPNIIDKNIEWIKCDISNKSDVDDLAVRLKKINEEIKVVFLAAFHNPDEVNKNPRFAWNINVTSLSYTVNALENVSRFFYVSTDSVYGESRRLESGGYYRFIEHDSTNPVNIYGLQKKAAEQIVLCKGYNVVRFPFLIGRSLVATKKHFFDVVSENLISGRPVEMLSDSYRSALTFSQVTALLFKLIEKKETPPIINVSGDDDLNKFDIGIMIADALGVSRDLIVPISLLDAGKFFESKRAKSTLMDNSLLKKTLGLSELKINFLE